MSAPLLKTTVLGLAETSINAALELDPATRQRLGRLDGKVLHIRMQAPAFECYLLPDAQGLKLQHRCEGEPDASISGSAFALMRLLSADNKAEVLFGKDIQIEGDIELSRELQQILADLQIDWEAKLADWVGDIAAHQIGGGVRAFQGWAGRTGDSLLRHVEEYLHEEARTLPPQAELEAFYEDIEQLVTATDRLAARIERLQAKVQMPSKPPAGETD